MSRRARIRATARAAKELSLIPGCDPTEPADFDDDPEPDERIPIGPTDIIELRDREPWPFPTILHGF